MQIFTTLSKLIDGRKTPQSVKYTCNEVFEGIDLAGKNLLEIGAGEGYLSAYASQYANHATAIEPQGQGSSEERASKIDKIHEALSADNFEVVHDTIQNYSCTERKYDIVLMHNSVNHLDEAKCMTLKESEDSRRGYSEIFEKISNMMSPGAKMIVIDCSRYNFFQLLHVKHPICPQIDWNKHQSPETWLGILEPLGFKKDSVTWLVQRPLSRLSFVLRNKCAAYFLFSQFRLVVSYCPTIQP
ncbi:MAG: class I SAM-dependent methyltransferase [Planctomycetota bacterium]|jgi:hypothetical protein